MSEEQWTNTREALWFLARLTIFLLAVCGLYEFWPTQFTVIVYEQETHLPRRRLRNASAATNTHVRSSLADGSQAAPGRRVRDLPAWSGDRHAPKHRMAGRGDIG